jgi:predicted transcriptional regulator
LTEEEREQTRTEPSAANEPLGDGPAQEGNGASSEERSEAETSPSEGQLFVRVNAVLPESQEIVAIEPGRPAEQALELMTENRFSQLPIVRGDRVIGLFSYRSYSAAAAADTSGRPGRIPVEDGMEDPIWVRAPDELFPLIDVLDARDVVLVGDEDNLQGVLTPLDVLRYLHELAEPFIRLRSIELSLRALVGAAVDEGQLAELASEALAEQYEERPDEPPTTLEDMTLGEIVAVVLLNKSWQYMRTTFGANRQNAVTHLDGLAPIRNAILHFRREIEPEERERIETTSDWLRTRVRATDVLGIAQ